MRAKRIFLWTWHIYIICLNTCASATRRSIIYGYEPDPILNELNILSLRSFNSDPNTGIVYANPNIDPFNQNPDNKEVTSSEHRVYKPIDNDKVKSRLAYKNKKDKRLSHGKEKSHQGLVENINNEEFVTPSISSRNKDDLRENQGSNGAWKLFMNKAIKPTINPWIQPEQDDNDKVYDAADLTKAKDSYEDYVFPKRDKKMYASEEDTPRNKKFASDSDTNEENETKKEEKRENKYIRNKYKGDYDYQSSKKEKSSDIRTPNQDNTDYGIKNPSDIFLDTQIKFEDDASIPKYDDSSEIDTMQQTAMMQQRKKRHGHSKKVTTNKKIARNKAKTAKRPSGEIEDSTRKPKSKLSINKLKMFDEPILPDEDYDPRETTKHVEQVEKAMIVEIGYDSEDESNLAPVKLKGTNIPKMDWFKISSPNYFVSLPAIAQKYDFNEPIPEIDREPEKLNYFSNPGAKINKKVEIRRRY